MAATRQTLRPWVEARTRPWKGSLDATMFSARIYDVLKPYAVEFRVAHPAKLKAITAARHSSDRLDAGALADRRGSAGFPGVWVAPTAIREQRIHSRFRNLAVRLSTQVQNRIAFAAR
jgi:hypothetical protein